MKYCDKQAQQGRGKFRDTSPFTTATLPDGTPNPDAAPDLFGHKLKRALNRDDRYLRDLLLEPYALWRLRRGIAP